MTFTTYCHIKHKDSPTAPAVCGREDSGQLYYVVLERGEPVPTDTGYPVCPKCKDDHGGVEGEGEGRN